MMKDKETFVGPCSKFVDGQGWTTEIPVQMMQEKGYIKIKDLNEKFVSLKAVKVAENSPKAMKMLVESVGCVQKDTAKEILTKMLANAKRLKEQFNSTTYGINREHLIATIEIEIEGIKNLCKKFGVEVE